MRKHFKQLASESLVYGLSKVFTRLVSFFFVPLYTHLFTPSEYGTLSITTNTFFFASIFVVFGLDTAAGVFFWDRNEEQEQKKTFSSWFWMQLLFSILAAFAFIIFSKGVSYRLLNTEDVSYYFILGAINLVFAGIPDILINWLRLQRRAKATFYFSAVTSVISIGCNILFVAVLKRGLEGVFLSQVITSAAGTVITLFMMKNWLSLAHVDLNKLKAMLRFSFPLIPAAIASWLLSASGPYFLEHYKGLGDAGIFQVGSTIASGMGIAIAAFQMAWGPFALSLQKNEKAKEIYAEMFRVYISAASLLAMALFLFAPEILDLFTSESYHSASYITGILGYNIVLTGTVYVASIGLNIVKTNIPYVKTVITGALLNIALYYLLIPAFSSEGAAIAILAGQTVRCIFLFSAAQKRYPIPYNFRYAIIVPAVSFFAGITTLYFLPRNFIPGLVIKIVITLCFGGIMLFLNKRILKK